MGCAGGLWVCCWGGGGVSGECGGVDVSGVCLEGEGSAYGDYRLGAIYNAGGFRVSTWIPFIWSLASLLVLVVSSFSIQGGL